jgi:hypothetical protein
MSYSLVHLQFVIPGWLEPLLDKVTKNWKTIAVPVFNFIDPTTFEIQNLARKQLSSVGGFKWDLMVIGQNL